MRCWLLLSLLWGGVAHAQEDTWPPSAASIWGEAAPSPAPAAVPAPAADAIQASGGRPALGVTLSGAISLGSYQAGQSYAFSRALAARNQEKQRRGQAQNLTITGASAGTINALLMGLSLTSGLVDGLPYRSPFFRTWIPIGFNGSESSLDAWRQPDRPGEDTDLLISKAAFSSLIRGLDSLFSAEGCPQDPRRCASVWAGDVRMGFQVSRLTPAIESGRSENLVNPSIIVSEAFAFNVDPAVPERAEVYTALRRQCMDGSPDCAATQTRVVAAPGEIVPTRAAVAALASTSVLFPVAFRVGTIDCPTYSAWAFHQNHQCVSSNDEPGTELRVWDGGLYENNPVRLTHDLMAYTINTALPSAPNIYFFDPGVTREFWSSQAGDLDMGLQARTTTQEGDQLLGLIGATFRLQSLASFMLDLEAPQSPSRPNAGAVELFALTQGTEPFSQEFMRFFGFYDRSIRIWDFYAGMFDFHAASGLGNELDPATRRQDMATIAASDPVYAAISGALGEAQDACMLNPRVWGPQRDTRWLETCVAEVAARTGDPLRGRLWRQCDLSEDAAPGSSRLEPAPDPEALRRAGEDYAEAVLASLACTTRHHFGAHQQAMLPVLEEMIALEALGEQRTRLDWGGWGARIDGLPPDPLRLWDNLVALTFVNLMRHAEVLPPGMDGTWSRSAKALASRPQSGTDGDSNLQLIIELLSADQDRLSTIEAPYSDLLRFHPEDLLAATLLEQGRTEPFTSARSLRSFFVSHAAGLSNRLFTRELFSALDQRPVVTNMLSSSLSLPAGQVQLTLLETPFTRTSAPATLAGISYSRTRNLLPSGSLAFRSLVVGSRLHISNGYYGVAPYIGTLGISAVRPWPKAAWGPLGKVPQLSLDLYPTVGLIAVASDRDDVPDAGPCALNTASSALTCRPLRLGLTGDVQVLGHLGLRLEAGTPLGLKLGEGLYTFTSPDTGQGAWPLSASLLLTTPRSPHAQRR